MPEDSIEELEALSAIAARLIPEAAACGQYGYPIAVRPAALSPDLPPDFPLPEGSRVIGSCTTGTFGLSILDVNQTPQGILRFYEEKLGAHGWYRHDTIGSGGFLRPGQSVSVQALFCRSSEGPALRVSTIRRAPTSTELHLQLDTDRQQSPCSRPPGVRPHYRRRGHLESPLPMVTAPPGATMLGFGRGGGGGRYQATATIETDLDLSQMADHVARQLVEAGWEPGAAGETGPVAWSLWTCPDDTGEQVDGLFLGWQQAPHLYALQVERDISRAARAEAEVDDRTRAQTMKQTAYLERSARVELSEGTIGEQVAALRELILRIVAPADPHNPEYVNPQLLAARLPDALPVDLPLPPATRVLGSLLLTARTTIYLESQTLPRQILSFYRERLAAPQWSFFGAARNLGGFTASQAPEYAGCQFCSATEEAGLSLSAHVTSSGVTDLRLQLVTDLRQTPCGNPNTPPAWEYRNRQPRLPELAAPSEGDFVGGGGNGSPSHWESRGYLSTGMTLSAVANHYGRQFQTSGWIRQDEGKDELVAWSRWTRQAEEYRSTGALFLAVRYPNTDRYFLVARAHYPDEASAPISEP